MFTGRLFCFIHPNSLITMSLKHTKFILIILFLLLTNNILGSGYICIVGGGEEDYNSWSDEHVRWIIEKSNNGSIIILSYKNESNWLPNYFISLGADTAENFIINSRELASRNSTYDKVYGADAVFIKGGDQSKYIEYWKGTRTEEAIIELYERGGVIAGTSAGAMLMGGIIFTAKRGSIDPGVALNNPFSSVIEFEKHFINLLPNTLVDTHFIENGRIGRLLTFMLKYQDTEGTELFGMGLDDNTALCIEKDTAIVFGSGAVSIFKSDINTLLKTNGNSYKFSDVLSNKLLKGWRYNISTQKIIDFSGNTTAKVFNPEMNIPANLVYLTGNDDFTFNFSEPFNKFRFETGFSRVSFILNESYEPVFSGIEHSLQSADVDYTKIPVSVDNLSDENLANDILNSDAMIFLGNDLAQLSLICSASTVLGNSIKSGIDSGKPLMFFGKATKIISPVFCVNSDTDPNATFYGELEFRKGLGLFPVIFQPGVYKDPAYYENNIASAEYGMIKESVPYYTLFDQSDYLVYDPAKGTIESTGKYAWIIADAVNAAVSDTSVFKHGTSDKTRQVIGIDNIRYTTSNNSDMFKFKDGKLVNLDSYNNNITPANFELYQNYPNPFNPVTTIEYTVPASVRGGTVQSGQDIEISTVNILLEVFDILGREVAILVNKPQRPGRYKVEFDASDLPSGVYPASGIYIYNLEAGSFNQSRKMILVK